MEPRSGPSTLPLPDDAEADHPKVQALRDLVTWSEGMVWCSPQEFVDDDRMLASPYYDRLVDMMEELVNFTLLTRKVSPYLVDRYSERKETGEALIVRVNRTAT